MDEYNQYELHHKSRLAAKPGLTGMWQVSGRSDFTDFEEIVKMDSDYIKKPESLITYVADRKGHDMRYAIDPTKIHKALHLEGLSFWCFILL